MVIKGSVMLRNNRTRFYLLSCGALLLSLVVARVTPGFDGDLAYFHLWGSPGFSKDLLHIYDSWRPGTGFTYPPLAIYIFAFLGWLGSLLGLSWPSPGATMLLKTIPVIGVFAGAYLVRDIARRLYGERAGDIRGLLYALSPALLVASSIWGQWDSILVLGILCAVWGGVTGKEWLIFVAIGATLMIKPQMLFATPALVACGFYLGDRKRFFAGVVPAIAAVLAIVAPFIAGGTWNRCLHVYLGAGSAHAGVSINADNFWVFYPLMNHVLDGRWSLGACNMLGAAAWVIITVVVLWKLRQRRTWQSGLWALFISAHAAFCMLTSMHERYVVPSAAIAVLLTMTDWRRKLMYVAINIAAVVNILVVYAGAEFPALPYCPESVSYATGLVNMGVLFGALFVYLASSRKLSANNDIRPL